MNRRELTPNASVVLPAELAARVTLVLAIGLVVFEIAIGALWTPTLRVVYAALCAIVALVTVLPRVTERVRAVLVVATWLASGGVGLFVAGLREGLVILMTSVALAAAFFGFRGGIATLACSVALAVAAAVVHVAGASGSPARFLEASHPEAWLLQVGVFAGLSFMVVLVQARHAEAVEASNDRARSFAVVAERSAASILFTDLEQRIVWVNEAFDALTGYRSDEVIGRRPGELLQGVGTDPEHVAAMRAAIAARAPCRVDAVNYRKDGVPYWVRIEIQPYRDVEGVLRGFTGSQIDVTAERMAQRFDAVERALFDDLSRAEAGDLDEVFARALSRCDSVSWVQVWRTGTQGLVRAASVTSPSRLGAVEPPSAPVATAFPAAGAAILMPTAADDERVVRVVSALTEDGGGLVEVGVWRAMPGLDSIGKRLPALATLYDLYLRRRTDAQRIADIFHRTPEALVVLDRDGFVSRVNDEASHLLPKLQVGAFMATSYPQLAPLVGPPSESDPGPDVGSEHRTRAAGSKGATFWVADDSGVERALEVNVRQVGHGGISDVLLSIRDLTERVRQLEATRASLEEKEVLLREIHHRVKNNLQIVSSLLGMQISATTDSGAIASLQESALRIHSMALVHSSIYGGVSLARVDFAQYIPQLLALIRQAFAPEARVEVEVAASEVSMDVAVPLGLVLTELITNSFKYGMRKADGGPRGAGLDEGWDLRVRWSREGEHYRLVVVDHGPGLPRGAGSKSLGLRLVDALCRQLRGTFEHALTAEGSTFTLRVPVVPETKSSHAGGPTNQAP